MFLFLLTALTAAGGVLGPVLDLLALVLEHPQLAGGILGLITPLLVSAINQPGLSTRQRRTIAYAAALTVGALTVISTGQYNAADLVSTLLVTIAVSQAAYAELWRPSGVAAAVEARTVLVKPEPETFSVIGEPGSEPGEVIDLWYEGVEFAGLKPAGTATVTRSFESDPDGGLIIAEGPVRPA